MNNSIFISYRRDGGSWSTRTLHDRLIAHFGNDRVFMDITDIDYGSDFASRIEKEIGRCDVLLAIITPGWLSTTDKSGKRRLDNPDDYVRIEIGMGLKRHIPVVPILVDGADMPGEAELPDDLKALSRRNAIELRHSHFDSDIKLLIDSLEKSIANEYPQRRLPAAAHAGNTMTRLYVLIGAVMAALLLAVSAYLMMRGGEQADSSVASAGDGGIAVSGDHVTINQQLNPELMQLVNNAVNRLSQQLETKDDQIRVRDEQTRQLSAAVAALSQTQDQANPPPACRTPSPSSTRERQRRPRLFSAPFSSNRRRRPRPQHRRRPAPRSTSARWRYWTMSRRPCRPTGAPSNWTRKTRPRATSWPCCKTHRGSCACRRYWSRVATR